MRQARIWRLKAPAADLAGNLAQETGISFILARLLINRGINTPEQAGRFLSPGLDQLHPWQLLPDIQPALARLRQARERGEKVLIHGDYDADGITAAALLMRFFRSWGLAAQYYIPHRIEDGYGLSEAGVEAAVSAGCTLLLTVDCGTGDCRQVEMARSQGLDVIITDHHLPPDALPPALAVVNPRRRDSEYPNPGLAGVGVACRLAMALAPGFPQDCSLQLAAVGTVADMVPLTGENRVLVAAGLKALNSSPLPGLAALAKVAGCRLGEVDSTNIAFHLAPRLNAAGRIDSAKEAVELLLARELEPARALAGELQHKNSRRQDMEEAIMDQALPQAADQLQAGRRVLVLHHPQWHQGVLGIAASRIVQRYYRPVLMISGSGVLTGSARSVEGFDIYSALAGARRWLDRFGGHRGAAGLTLQEHNLERFSREIDRQARAMGVDRMLTPVLELDGVLKAGDVNKRAAEEIALLQPFGTGNPEPLFQVEGFRAGRVLLAGGNRRHLRLCLDGGGKKVWAIGFGLAHQVHNIGKGERVKLAANLQLNRWNGTVSPQLRISETRDTSAFKQDGLLIRDRRREANPWLEVLAAAGEAVWFANCQHAVRLPGEGQRVYGLRPDNFSPRVYNLKVGEYCLLEAPWSSEIFHQLIKGLPPGSILHLFDRKFTLPQVAFPGRQLLRRFYHYWQKSGCSLGQLQQSLPPELAHPLTRERMLNILAEAGLARKAGEEWLLIKPGKKVDLTAVESWQRYRRQEQAYRAWAKRYREQPLKQLMAPGAETEEVG